MTAPPQDHAAGTGSVAGSAADAAASSVTVMTIVTAVGTALAAFQLFQPKLAIGMAMKRETGRVEPGFSVFYTVPQYIIGAIVLLVWLVLVIAVLHQFAPGFVPAYAPVRTALTLLTLNNLIPVLLLLVVIASAIQMNILSWLFLLAGRAVSMLPIAATSDAFAPTGRSAGWLQAWCVCRTWDKGQPLLIAQEEIGRVGDEVLQKLSASSYKGRNFADKPAHATTAGAANIAVLGCILEQAHTSNRWTAPASWGDFYKELDDINRVKKIFEPAVLVTYASGQQFSQTLRDELASRMHAKGQPVPEGKYFGAASYLARSWEMLLATEGSLLEMMPFYARAFGGRVYWLDRLLSTFPLLREEGMRQQALKLLTRWDVTPWAKEASFSQPFSKTLAWMLLEEGVLTTLPEQSDVTFRANGDVAISKVACRRIFGHVKRSAEERFSAEAISVARRFPEEWDLFAAADYTLWNWARQQFKAAKDENWEGWRWKLEDGRAIKVG